MYADTTDKKPLWPWPVAVFTDELAKLSQTTDGNVSIVHSLFLNDFIAITFACLGHYF